MGWVACGAANIALSSNGRTNGFEPEDVGPNPAEATSAAVAQLVERILGKNEADGS